jgi:hypothetical protein
VSILSGYWPASESAIRDAPCLALACTSGSGAFPAAPSICAARRRRRTKSRASL